MCPEVFFLFPASLYFNYILLHFTLCVQMLAAERQSIIVHFTHMQKKQKSRPQLLRSSGSRKPKSLQQNTNQILLPLLRLSHQERKSACLKGILSNGINLYSCTSSLYQQSISHTLSSRIWMVRLTEEASFHLQQFHVVQELPHVWRSN